MRRILSIILIITSISAHSFKNEMWLDIHSCIDTFNINTNFLAFPDSIFRENNQQIDSVQFSFNEDLDNITGTPLKAIVSKAGGIINYKLITIKETIQKSFAADSIKEWSASGTGFQHGIIVPMRNPLFLLPDTKITYNNRELNDFPLTLKSANVLCLRSPFDNYVEAYFDISKPKTNIVIFENGNRHYEKIQNSKTYKSSYLLGDSCHFGSVCMRFDSLDVDNQKVKVCVLNDFSPASIPEKAMSEIAPYFKDNDLMLIDFWGTWCVNCLEIMPFVKDVSKNVRKSISLLSICIDEEYNKNDAFNIFEQNGFTSPLLFVSKPQDKDMFLKSFRITYFPVLFLIRRDGLIVENWVGSEEILSNLKFEY